MPDVMPALDDLELFVRVAERGAFAQVARELGVPTSTVSRAVARLEEALKVRLLQRTTRSLRTTGEGQALYARAAPALLALKEAVRETETGETEPRGRLRLTAPADVGAALVADVVAEFTAAHPEVTVEACLSNRVVNLVQEGFDVALRAGRLADSSLIARRIGGLESHLFASPDYLKRHAAPRSPADLERHELVLFRARNGSAVWKLEGPRGQASTQVHGRIEGDDFLFVREAVRAGAGIGLMPRLICARELSDGSLVRVLPSWEERGAVLHFVYPSARHPAAKVTAFRDFVVRRFGTVLPPSERRGSPDGGALR